ncbi:MAG: hypothetical protein WCA45_02455 [Thiobacillaceae bacterium]
MSDSINVPISSSIFVRLQRLAIPLVDNTSSVIEKLIDHWEANPPDSAPQIAPAAKASADVWRSPRGDVLPVGAPLQGEYLGKTFRATVEKKGIRFGGKLYDSPSAAAVAAKEQLGRKGRAASTDGRKFWKIRDPMSGRSIPIAALRPAQHIDAEALLAELSNS